MSQGVGLIKLDEASLEIPLQGPGTAALDDDLVVSIDGPTETLTATGNAPMVIEL